MRKQLFHWRTSRGIGLSYCGLSPKRVQFTDTPESVTCRFCADALFIEGRRGLWPNHCEMCGEPIADSCYVSIGPAQTIFCFKCCPVGMPKLRGERIAALFIDEGK